MKIKVNKKLLIIVGVLVVLVIGGALIYRNYSENQNEKKKEEERAEQEQKELAVSHSGPVVNIYYFHGTSRCWSCITAEDYAREALNTYFPQELKDGKITFASINAQKPANFQEEGLAKKFDISYNSLIINKIKDKEIGYENVQEIWQNLNNKDQYVALIKQKVESALKEIQ